MKAIFTFAITLDLVPTCRSRCCSPVESMMNHQLSFPGHLVMDRPSPSWHILHFKVEVALDGEIGNGGLDYGKKGGGRSVEA
ncbi:hypothetical protein BDK51DRAFT_50668 [Blyttiomyces helicus]|uniref:Secreted protein n=1 Tax=Blyttiomyces helicus TaxID=388810 RepID=A0A4P9WGJ7_9FUNG|nr:hypothetical protein BDK51DRAFT_50668 [Blyttiomyces helicus]|eukprot:RKO91939.1 hypothetical protein BDK51DRAFT_50668 [Blyttiomyces helicus]